MKQAMKKLILIGLSVVALSCGQSDRETGSENRRSSEAAPQEDVDIGSGEVISPQLELDSSDSRFEVDTISSSEEARRKAKEGSF